MPERWLKSNISQSNDDNDRKFKTDANAFIPFSMGPANCAGKNLAMLELRMVVALVIQQFNIRFASELDGGPTIEWEREMEEWFVMKPGRLMVVLSKRV